MPLSSEPERSALNLSALSFEPQCHYSRICPQACVNTVYINTLMSSFYVVPWCAQLVCGRNLSRRMPLSFEPERSALNLSALSFEPQCHYSLICTLACVNTVYINTLMSSFHVVPWCAQLACGRNLSNRMPLSSELERAPPGLCKYYLYRYTHALLSCCTLVCPIGMWAKPEQSNAPQL